MGNTSRQASEDECRLLEPEGKLVGEFKCQVLTHPRGLGRASPWPVTLGIAQWYAFKRIFVVFAAKVAVCGLTARVQVRTTV